MYLTEMGEVVEGLKEEEVLLSDYVRGRDDERAFYAAMGATLAGALAITGLIFNVLSTAGCLSWTVSNSCAVDDSFIALLPLIPVAAFAYQTWLAVDATFRSFYLRGLEAKIREQVRGSAKAADDQGPEGGVPVASFSSMTAIAHSQTSFDQPVSFLTALIWSVMGLVALAIVGVSWIQVEWYWRIAMLAVYLPAISVVFYAGTVAAFRGRKYTERTIDAFWRQSDEPLFRKRRKDASRTPVSYFLAPGVDHLATASVTMIGFSVPIIAGWTPNSFAASWPDFLPAIIAFEFLLQQSKYAFNDIRSVAEDEAHPLKGVRGRLGALGVSTRTGIGVALASIAWRVLLFLSFVIIIPGYKTPLLVALVALVLHVGVYEALRRFRLNATKAASEALVAIALISWVGLGYGLRLWFGWTYAVGSVTLPPIGWATCLFAAALGSFMCALTWEIEAATYVFVQPVVKKRIEETRGSVVNGPGCVAPSIEFKPHIRWLSKWSIPPQLRSEGTRSDFKDGSRVSLRDLTLLKLPMSLHSPHLAVGAVAIAATALVGDGRQAWLPWAIILTNVAVLGVVTRMRIWGLWWTAATLAAVFANVLVWLATGRDPDQPGVLCAGLLWLAVALFGGNAPEQIFGLPAQIARGLRAAGHAAAQWILGSRAVAVLESDSAQRTSPSVEIDESRP
jgi:hypothetical protein